MCFALAASVKFFLSVVCEMSKQKMKKEDRMTQTQFANYSSTSAHSSLRIGVWDPPASLIRLDYRYDKKFWNGIKSC